MGEGFINQNIILNLGPEFEEFNGDPEGKITFDGDTYVKEE